MKRYSDNQEVPIECPVCGACVLGPMTSGRYTTFECEVDSHYLLAVSDFISFDYVEQIGIGKYVVSNDSGSSYCIALAGSTNLFNTFKGVAPNFKSAEEIENFLLLQ